MGQNWDISNAIVADAEGITKTNCLAWGQKISDNELVKRSRKLENEIKETDDTQKGLFVAKRNGSVIGFARIVCNYERKEECCISGIVVHPDCQRQGIGRELVEICIGFAKDRNATLVRSETHLTNTVSLKFHESIGFNNDGILEAPDGDRKVKFSIIL